MGKHVLDRRAKPSNDALGRTIEMKKKSLPHHPSLLLQRRGRMTEETQRMPKFLRIARSLKP